MIRNVFMALRRLIGGQLIFDCLAWIGAIILAAVSRNDFQTENIIFSPLIAIGILASIFQIIFGVAFHLYRGRFRIATIDELKALVLTTACVGTLLVLILLPFGPTIYIPRGTALFAPLLFVCASSCMRIVRRIRQSRQIINSDSSRTLIYGAGSMAESLIPQLRNDPRGRYLPVGLIDDSSSKQNRWINGVPMLGQFSELTEIASRTGAETLIVCIARADANFLKNVEEICRKLKLDVKVFPNLDDVLRGHSGVGDIRDLSIEDIVGRRPIDTEVENIASYLTGKNVLVTGAGGSIGSELCRQISRFGPSKLVMMDRDETGLQLAQLGVSGHGLLDTKDIILADIREPEVLNAHFIRERPDVVFHAAALKHLPVLEQFPDEAWKTNVIGTKNVLEAAKLAGVATFINISTDKAADPSSILGKSKKIAEKLTSWFGIQENQNYLSVRFGNVLGSRGSLLPTFTKLIEQGGPLTVTHPEATRFFMTIPEACQLVLQAGAIGKPLDVMILDMGSPVRILDIANRMIELSNKKIEIIFTGLRPGEKLHEDLYGNDENQMIRSHDLISHATVKPISPDELDRALFL